MGDLQCIRRQEIEEALGDSFILNAFVSKEFAYDKKLTLVTIRVYSTIPRMENYREEFIRVCMLHGISERLMTWFRVPRDFRWRTNLGLRIRQIIEEGNAVRYCECGGLLHVKRSAYGKFVACTKCQFKQNVRTVVIEHDTTNSIRH
ncbi:MAG: hypothetical protein V1799_07890 [bacterium]